MDKMTCKKVFIKQMTVLIGVLDLDGALAVIAFNSA
jgi:hypothetical protein